MYSLDLQYQRRDLCTEKNSLFEQALDHHFTERIAKSTFIHTVRPYHCTSIAVCRKGAFFPFHKTIDPLRTASINREKGMLLQCNRYNEIRVFGMCTVAISHLFFRIRNENT